MLRDSIGLRKGRVLVLVDVSGECCSGSGWVFVFDVFVVWELKYQIREMGGSVVSI